MSSDSPRKDRGELVFLKRLSVCREDILIKSLIGLGVGLLPALLIFRGRFMRGLITGLGAGVGLGWGYGDCDVSLRSHGRYSDRTRVTSGSNEEPSGRDDEEDDRDSKRDEKDLKRKKDK